MRVCVWCAEHCICGSYIMSGATLNVSMRWGVLFVCTFAVVLQELHASSNAFLAQLCEPHKLVTGTNTPPKHRVPADMRAAATCPQLGRFRRRLQQHSARQKSSGNHTNQPISCQSTCKVLRQCSHTHTQPSRPEASSHAHTTPTCSVWPKPANSTARRHLLQRRHS